MNRKELLDAAKTAAYRTNFFVMDKAKYVPFLWPTPKLVSGVGAALKTPQVLRELGISHVMVVTGPRSGKALAQPILDALQSSGIAYEHYSEVEANPSIETVEAIYSLYHSTGCNGFLAIGGGSPIDATKGAAARAARPKTPLPKLAGVMKLMVPTPPIVAIPTTAGTGSEAGFVAVITDHQREMKFAITDPHLIPKAAILDPMMTVSMPKSLTATTGVDALTHAIESYTNAGYRTDFTIRCAEEAVVKIFRNLEKAYADGEDIEARTQLLDASYKAGLAFTRTGVGNVHAIAHALGGKYGIAHGLANSVILPIVLEDYGPVVYTRLAHLAELTGVMSVGSDEQKAKAFIAAIRALNQRLGLPTGLDMIKPEDFDHVAKTAVYEATHTYPTPVIYTVDRCRHVLNRILIEA